MACEQPRSANASGELSAAEIGVDAPAAYADTALAAAARELDAGHPWRATQRLAPVLRDPRRRTPAAILLAARAAAGWEGWAEVQRLLRGASWLDGNGALGRELLARAALESGDDSAAVAQADAAVRHAPTARARGVRLTLLARALDRIDARDSAAATYQAAAARLPSVGDWLLLRAAGVEVDSLTRTRLYAGVHSPAARARIAWTEAQALERTGARAQAAARFAALGALPSAYRLRFALATDGAARAQLADEVLAFVRSRSGTPAARQAVELLDANVQGTLSPADELVIARSAAESGPASRAITAYSRASALLSDADRLRYGDLLARTGEYARARGELERVSTPSLAGVAAYQRARALMLAGDGSGARDALRDVARRFAADAAAAGDALYLLADLRTDDGADGEARDLFTQLYTRYPGHAHADDARFRAALISYVGGDRRQAAAAMDSLVARYPRSEEVSAALYWAGRAWAAAGDRRVAGRRWREVIDRDPLSYYAGRAARRLGAPAWRAAAAPAAMPRVRAVDSAIARIDLLRDIGMDAEARFEIDALEDAARESPGRLLATAAALRDHGEPSRAIRLGLAAIERGVRDVRSYRLAYPRIDADALVRAARARKLDPAFVAGLIRQESSWYPRAVSPAGARGLMQVMPSVGSSIARTLGFPVWEPGLLFDPDANLELGTAHLASALRDYDDPIRALAAYNAGASRVARWSDKKGVDDPEVFAERIPFNETRDYVRIVTRNAEIYRALYSW